jgi:hypothetical protein
MYLEKIGMKKIGDAEPPASDGHESIRVRLIQGERDARCAERASEK